MVGNSTRNMDSHWATHQRNMVNINDLSVQGRVVSMGVATQIQQPAVFAVPVGRTLNHQTVLANGSPTVLAQPNQPQLNQSALSADLSSIEPTLPIDQSNLLFKQQHHLANQVDQKAKK